MESGVMRLAEDFVIMNRNVEIGSGGAQVVWRPGAPLKVVLVPVRSDEAVFAEVERGISIFTGTAYKNFPLERSNVLKRLRDGDTFRIKSDPADREMPEMSSQPVKVFTAEKWDIPPEELG